MAILTDGQSWNPVLDQEYYLQFEGFEDLVYTAKVTRVQKVDNEVLAVFLVEDPMGPMIYQRSGRVTLSSELSGLSVLSEALGRPERADGRVAVRRAGRHVRARGSALQRRQPGAHPAAGGGRVCRWATVLLIK